MDADVIAAATGAAAAIASVFIAIDWRKKKRGEGFELGMSYALFVLAMGFFLIFAGKLKHRETVTRCDLPLRPLMQTLCVWGPTSFFPAFSRGNETA